LQDAESHLEASAAREARLHAVHQHELLEKDKRQAKSEHALRRCFSTRGEERTKLRRVTRELRETSKALRRGKKNVTKPSKPPAKARRVRPEGAPKGLKRGKGMPLWVRPSWH